MHACVIYTEKLHNSPESRQNQIRERWKRPGIKRAFFLQNNFEISLCTYVAVFGLVLRARKKQLKQMWLYLVVVWFATYHPSLDKGARVLWFYKAWGATSISPTAKVHTFNKTRATITGRGKTFYSLYMQTRAKGKVQVEGLPDWSLLCVFNLTCKVSSL